LFKDRVGSLNKVVRPIRFQKDIPRWDVDLPNVSNLNVLFGLMGCFGFGENGENTFEQH